MDIQSGHVSCGVEGAVPVPISLQCFVARVAYKHSHAPECRVGA